MLGVSFGGMIATEFAKFKQPSKLYLISTINSTTQLPFIFKIGSVLSLYKMVPTGIVRRCNFITNYLFGTNTKEDKKLLNEILRDTDPKFLKWAIGAIVNWKNTEKPKGIVIHGSNDKMLPINQETQYKIDGGGHFMIVNRGKEISAILEKSGA